MKEKNYYKLILTQIISVITSLNHQKMVKKYVFISLRCNNIIDQIITYSEEVQSLFHLILVQLLVVSIFIVMISLTINLYLYVLHLQPHPSIRITEILKTIQPILIDYKLKHIYRLVRNMQKKILFQREITLIIH